MTSRRTSSRFVRTTRSPTSSSGFRRPTRRSAGDSSATVKLSTGATLEAAVSASGARAGDPVTLGIRPEHLTLSRTDDGIAASVALIEWLGNMRFAYLATDVSEEPLIMQLTSHDEVQEGQPVKVLAAPAHCYLFDSGGQAFPRPSDKPGSLAA